MRTISSRPPSRSEQVRQRRNAPAPEAPRRAPAVKPIKKPATNAAPSRPVFVRSPYGSPSLTRPQSKVKRKYFFSLAQGTELSLPAIPVIRPGWRSLSGLLTLGLAILLVFISSSDMFEVNQVEIQGLQRLNPAEVQAVMGLQGSPIFAVDPAVAVNKVRDNFPELADIRLMVGLPNSVTLTARERQPVIAWHYGDITLWIDPEGAVFLPRGEAGLLLDVLADDAPPMVQIATPDSAGEAPLTPLDNLFTPKSSAYNPEYRRVDPDILASIATLFGQMPPDATLAYHSQEGFGWQDNRGWKVYFGRKFDQLDLKIRAYQMIVDELEARGIRPVMISVAHLEAPFYRVEQ